MMQSVVNLCCRCYLELGQAAKFSGWERNSKNYSAEWGRIFDLQQNVAVIFLEGDLGLLNIIAAQSENLQAMFFSRRLPTFTYNWVSATFWFPIFVDLCPLERSWVRQYSHLLGVHGTCKY